MWNTKVTSSSGGSVERGRDEGVRHALLDAGDAALLDGHRVELLGGAVAGGVGAEELERAPR